MNEDKLMKISELAEEAHVMTSTIRHYSELGLLRVAGYTEGGHRLFASVECLERIAKIQTLAKRGMALPEIKLEIEGKVKTRKLLLVDDETESIDVMTQFVRLKFPDWIVETATDGFSAGRKLVEFLPDLVVLDLMLPGVNGFEIMKQIRSSVEMRGIKIIAITGYDTAEMKAKVFENGADDYLAKPMEPRALFEKIKILLGVATPPASPPAA